MSDREYYDLQRYLSGGEESILPVDEMISWCDPPEDPDWPAPTIPGQIRDLLHRLPVWAQVVCALTATQMAYPIWEQNFHILPGIEADPFITYQEWTDAGPLGTQVLKGMAERLRNGPAVAIAVTEDWLAAPEYLPTWEEFMNSRREAARSAAYAHAIWERSAGETPEESLAQFYLGLVDPENREMYNRLGHAALSAARLVSTVQHAAALQSTVTVYAAQAIESGLEALELQYVGMPGTTALKRWWQLCRCRLAVSL